MIKSLAEDMSLLKPKRQVVYVPGHLRDDFLLDPAGAVEAGEGVQRGFITSWNTGGVFCRYFLEGSYIGLRTTGNSERANFGNVFPYEHSTDYYINWLWGIYVEPVEEGDS